MVDRWWACERVSKWRWSLRPFKRINPASLAEKKKKEKKPNHQRSLDKILYYVSGRDDRRHRSLLGGAHSTPFFRSIQRYHIQRNYSLAVRGASPRSASANAAEDFGSSLPTISESQWSATAYARPPELARFLAPEIYCSRAERVPRSSNRHSTRALLPRPLSGIERWLTHKDLYLPVQSCPESLGTVKSSCSPDSRHGLN